MGDCLSRCFSSFSATFRPNDARNDNNRNIPLIPHITKPPAPYTPDDFPKPPTENEIEPGGTDDSVLAVESVDLCIQENAAEHYTAEYDAVEKSKLVVRRGAPFNVKITLKRPYNADKDVVCLVCTIKDVKKPSYSNQTLIVIPVLETSDEVMPTDAWQAKLLNKEGKTITVQVMTAPNAIVGEWAMDVDTKQKKDNEEDAKSLRFTVKSPIYLLFNPWCKQDTVYVADPEWRKEYVLNENGLLWRGTHSRLRECVWNYGQFQENILECCFYLLNHGPQNLGVNVVARSDPIRVVRHISAVVNSPDDKGVLEGNWNGNYSGGTAPTEWNGSMDILQKFYKTKKTVKFGQCWVFSGVCTTICRALGIACRSVTNFSSAHDTHNSLTIDYFFDKEGEPIERLNDDSVWNFHVWNEVWMERPDLEPGGYGGWQVIDATPQEESDGSYRCGPASVAAVKRGEIQKNYDNAFVFAEVNADKVYWRYHGPSKPLKLIKKTTDAIGQFISTKAIGSYEREDITHEYKYTERTKEEREVMLKALRQANNVFSRYYLNDEMEDIEFDFVLLDDIIIGSQFTVKLTAKHKNVLGKDKEYNIEAMLRVDSMLYTGRLKHPVKKEKFQAKLTPGQEKEFTLHVNYMDYERAIVDQADFNIAAMAKVKETNFEYFGQDDFRVRMPDIVVEAEGPFVKGQEFTASASFKNPIPKNLTKAYFVIEGPGLGQPIKIPVKGTTPVGGEPRVTFKLTPKSSGEKVIAAKFHSKELSDVDGYKVIQVEEPPSANDVINKPTDGLAS